MKKRLIRGGLQHRLILSVMLVFCMPILLIGGFILNSLHEKLMANAQVSARTAITTVQQEITHTLTNAQDSLSLLASDDELYYFYPITNKQQCAKWALIVDEIVKGQEEDE